MFKTISFLKTNTQSLSILFITIAVSACAKNDPQFSVKLSEAVSQVGCNSVEGKVFDSIYYHVLQYKKMPDIDFIRTHLATLEKQNPVLKKHSTKFENAYAKIINTVQTRALTKLQSLKSKAKSTNTNVNATDDVGSRILDLQWEELVRLELGLQPDEISLSIKDLKSNTDIKNMNCESEVPTSTTLKSPIDSVNGSTGETKNSETSRFVQGTYWTMATAYQSCQVLTMPPLNISTPMLEGVVEVGHHADGVGTKRIIGDLKLVQTTHPYLKDIHYDNNCTKVSDSPLIYDYGGKPYVDPNTQKNLNFFVNAGSGTKTLGVDCSGFVFSALAAGGLRVAAGKTLKAPQVNGISAKMYQNPQDNGLSCFQKISVGVQSTAKGVPIKEVYLSAGDIIATSGHVVIVDQVGEDPFGIANVSTAADCNQLKWSQFDFVISQSSNTKGAVGIDRFTAKDYIENNPTFQVGLMVYAKESCLAKIQKTIRTPKSAELSVVRHKGTTDCMGTTIPLVGEACIKNCPNFVRN